MRRFGSQARTSHIDAFTVAGIGTVGRKVVHRVNNKVTELNTTELNTQLRSGLSCVNVLLDKYAHDGGVCQIVRALGALMIEPKIRRAIVDVNGFAVDRSDKALEAAAVPFDDVQIWFGIEVSAKGAGDWYAHGSATYGSQEIAQGMIDAGGFVQSTPEFEFRVVRKVLLSEVVQAKDVAQSAGVDSVVESNARQVRLNGCTNSIVWGDR